MNMATESSVGPEDGSNDPPEEATERTGGTLQLQESHRLIT